MHYEVISCFETGFQVWRFSTEEEAKIFMQTKCGIKNPRIDKLYSNKFGCKFIYQIKNEPIPDIFTYWEDSALANLI